MATHTERVANKDDEIVERELNQFWVRPGERLLFGCPPLLGYVGGRIGGEIRVPHQPISDMPEVDLGKCRWPLPAEFTAHNPHVDEDWIDDPTLAFWFNAASPNQDAVCYADHFAYTRGTARLVISSARTAIVYPTTLLAEKSDNPFTTFGELDTSQIRGFAAPFLGRSIPPPSVIQLDFADRSTLWLRDPLATLRVHRAWERMR